MRWLGSVAGSGIHACFDAQLKNSNVFPEFIFSFMSRTTRSPNVSCSRCIACLSDGRDRAIKNITCTWVPSLGDAFLAYVCRITFRLSADRSIDITPTKIVTGARLSANSCGNDKVSWQYVRQGSGFLSGLRYHIRNFVRERANILSADKIISKCIIYLQKTNGCICDTISIRGQVLEGRQPTMPWSMQFEVVIVKTNTQIQAPSFPPAISVHHVCRWWLFRLQSWSAAWR